jgi:Tfp pilus assembly protein FimT
MIKGVQVGLIVLAILAIVGGLAAVRFARTTSS